MDTLELVELNHVGGEVGLGKKVLIFILTTKCASGTPSVWEFYEIHNRNIEICPKISRQVL